MASLNRVCLLGRLTRNPDVRHSPNGTPVAALGLVVNNRIKRSATKFSTSRVKLPN